MHAGCAGPCSFLLHAGCAVIVKNKVSPSKKTMKTVANKKHVSNKLWKLRGLNRKGIICFDVQRELVYNTFVDQDDLESSYTILEAKIPIYDAHLVNTSNPHSVTKANVGLGSVENYSKATLFTDPTFTGTFASTATNFVIKDPMLRLNVGETGAGITDGFAGIYIDRGTLDDAYLIYSETDSCFELGIAGSLARLSFVVDSPTDTGIAVWDNVNKRFQASFLSSEFVTASSTTTFTNKTIDDCAISGTTIIDTTMLTEAVETSGNYFATGGYAATYIPTYTVPRTERLFSAGDALFENETGYASNWNNWNIPITFYQEAPAAVDTTVQGFYIGIDASSISSSLASGYAVNLLAKKDSVDGSTDAILAVKPRVGYSGTGYTNGTSKGYPTSSQLEDGIYIRRGMLGVGQVPQHELDVLGDAWFRGPAQLEDTYTVSTGAMIRKGNVVKVQSDGTVQEYSGGSFSPAGQSTLLTGAVTYMSRALSISSKRVLAVHRSGVNTLLFTIIGVDGTTLSTLSTGSFTLTGSSDIRPAAMMLDGRKFIALNDNNYMCFRVTDDNVIEQTSSEKTLSSTTAGVTEAVAMTETEGAFIAAGSTGEFKVIKYAFDAGAIEVGTSTTAGTGTIAAVSAIRLTDELGVGVYAKSLVYYARAFTMDDPPTVGAEANYPFTFSTNYAFQGDACALTETTFLTAGRDNATGYLVYVVGTVTGTTIAFGSAQNVLAAVTSTAKGRPTTTQIGYNRAVIGYFHSSEARLKYYDPAKYASPYLSAEIVINTDTGYDGGIPVGLVAPLGQNFDVVSFASGADGLTVRLMANTLDYLTPNIRVEGTLSYQHNALYSFWATTGTAPLQKVDDMTVLMTLAYGLSAVYDAVCFIKRIGNEINMNTMSIQNSLVLGSGSRTSVMLSDGKILANYGAYQVLGRTKADFINFRLMRYMPIVYDIALATHIGQNASMYVVRQLSPTPAMIASCVVDFGLADDAPTYGTRYDSSLSSTISPTSLFKLSRETFVISYYNGTNACYKRLTVTAAGVCTWWAERNFGTASSDPVKTSTNGILTQLTVYRNGSSIYFHPSRSNLAGSDLELGTAISDTCDTTETEFDVCHVANNIYAVSFNTSTTVCKVSLIHSFANRAMDASSIYQGNSVTIACTVSPVFLCPFDDEYLLAMWVNATYLELTLLRIDKSVGIIGIAATHGYSGSSVTVREFGGSCFDHYTAGRTYTVDTDGHVIPSSSKYTDSLDGFAVRRGINAGRSVSSTELMLEYRQPVDSRYG